MSDLTGGRRAQFIPVFWRKAIDFEDESILTGDHEEEKLGNPFTLDDIEIKESLALV
jgi:hypothetical protein